GHFLAYWKRGADRQWKLAAWVYNSRAETQPAIPAAFATPDNKHRRAFPHADVAADREAVKAADAAFSAYSVQHGTGPAFQRFAAPTAMIIGGEGALVFGPEAIGPSYESPDSVEWAPLFADATASGDLGFTVGYATFHQAGGAKRYTKYLTVWQKQDTGEWLYVSDNGNSRPAP
ncbi:MAG TPA: DUF4440 domain-containing protein, partial [Longimicrobium sp.]|nr:DUF4440 domain-containing protein [Longimicrobium sp.]